MSDELQTVEELPDALAALMESPEDDTPSEEVEQVVEQAPVDPVVEKASKSGWTDKEAWVAAGKDPDEWIDAKEFVSRKPLYDKLHAQAKALKDKEEKLEAVSKYAAKAAEAGYKKAIKELQDQRREQIQAGDVEAVEALDRQIEEVKQELQPPVEEKPSALPVPAEVTDFAERNEKWFEKDKPMTVFMVAATQEYTAAGKPLAEALKLAEADVKREFAHKFVNPNKEKPSAVASGNREARAKSYGYNDLTQDQRQVYAAMKSHMSLDDFIKGLQEQGELK